MENSKSKFNILSLGKKAYSIGFSWVYALVSLFSIGILYIVFSQVFKGHLVPVITGMANVSTIPMDTQAAVIGGISKYMTFFDFLPFVLFFVIVLYMIVVAIRKPKEEVYE